MNRIALLLWAGVCFAQGSADIVISQVFGGGGNAGAPLRNDFIELFNRGAAPVNVTGWSVQYTSAAGSDWQVTPLTGTIQPGRYFLVRQAAGANTAAAALPDPDSSGAVAMSATAAKVALVRNDVALTGTQASGPNVADFVGYGTATGFETSPAPGLTNTTAALRRGNGCVDTDNNSADFQTGTPRPRNSQSAPLLDCDEAPSEATPLTISGIQGAGDESPVAGQRVLTRGIVTGRKTNGFFLQSTSEEDDGNPATSEGLFVFTSSAPPAAAAVGSLVEVTGTVAEFRPPSDLGSPPLTELIDPVVQGIATGMSLPIAVTLATVVNLETVEGMRVTAPQLRAVSPTGGTISEPNGTATSNGVFYGIEAGSVRPFTSASGNLGGRLVRVDSRSLGRPALDVQSGDLTGVITGPLDFAFRTYTIASEGSVLVFSANRPSTFVAKEPNEFAVASMNLQRLFDTVDDPGTSDPVLTPIAFPTRITRTAAAIRDVLGSPEIIGVAEVENLAVLEALGAATGDYAAYTLEGNDIGGIDVGVLVRRDRVTVQSFAQEGKDSRIDGTDILNDRPPVVLRATVSGLPVVIVVNHLRSLINADSPVVARKRLLQAEFLSALLRRERAENVISVGDYNMDQYDPLMQVITSSGLFNLNETLRPNEAYTYVFDGVTQALDHIIVSPSALNYLTRYQIAHINADFPESLRNNPASTNRISDHDVPIAYFAATPPPFRFRSVASSANYVSGSVAPNEWVSIFAPGPVSQVLADGQPATIVSSTAQQTTVTLPATLQTGVRSLRFGADTVSVPVAAAAPGIFTMTGTGQGQGAILNQDWTVNGLDQPAPRGSVIAIYGTGVNDATCATTVWIGGARAQVTYSGVAPGLPAGIQQINARVPNDATVGPNVPILVASGDEVSASGVTVAIR